MKKTKILGKYELLLILVICVLLLVFGAKKTGGDIKQSNIPRDTSPQVSDTDIQNLVSRNTDFAFDLYRILAENEDGNLFYSPYSISTVSAMIYSGANGETKQEIKDIFHFDLPEEALHSSFNAFDLNLKQDILVSTNAEGLDSPPKLKLEFINALWVQKGFPFEKVFLDNLAENYGAGARILDFIKHPEKSRQAINEWVSEKTNGLIQETFPEEMIDHRARVVIVNSFLFDAAWSYIDFIPYNGKFTLLDNSEISVPMMSAVDYFGYYEDENFTAVEIPYYDYLHSLIIVSPKNSIFEEIEETINSSFFQSLQGNLTYPSYKLNIPKFSFETNLDLKKYLQGMGMVSLFYKELADFSGISNQPGLYIAEFFQKTIIEVNEEGTIASGVTAVYWNYDSAGPGEDFEITIDSPFIFFIIDNETRSILFMGRVLNPLE